MICLKYQDTTPLEIPIRRHHNIYIKPLIKDEKQISLFAEIVSHSHNPHTNCWEACFIISLFAPPFANSLVTRTRFDFMAMDTQVRQQWSKTRTHVNKESTPEGTNHLLILASEHVCLSYVFCPQHDSPCAHRSSHRRIKLFNLIYSAMSLC